MNASGLEYNAAPIHRVPLHSLAPTVGAAATAHVRLALACSSLNVYLSTCTSMLERVRVPPEGEAAAAAADPMADAGDATE